MDVLFQKLNGGTQGRKAGAFTLMEILISMALLSVMIVVMSQVVSGISSVWKRTSNKMDQFSEGRAALESISRTLSQATLNPYWDYQRASVALPPTGYLRQSELRFLSGPASVIGLGVARVSHALAFQAPLGLTSGASVVDTAGLHSLLNTCGYFIEFGSDASLRPSFLGTRVPLRYRYRLVEMRQPADELAIYTYTSGTDSTGQSKALTYTGSDWFLAPLSLPKPPVQFLAENIVAMIVLPQLAEADQTNYGLTPASLAPKYLYNSSLDGQKSVNALLGSKNQLPPVISVMIVAVDEASYSRFQGSSTTMPASLGLANLFQTVGDTLDSTKAGYAHDLQTLENNLQANHINYHIFTTKIAIPGSKWSAL